MIWLYAIAAAFVVAAGVTVVETYKHAVTSAATSRIEADQANVRAHRAEQSKANLQELVDDADILTKEQKAELVAKDAAIRDREARIRAMGKADPVAFACEDVAVPSAVRELRRNAAATAGPGSVLHPPNAAGADGAPGPAGRDLRPASAGSGPGPQGAGGVQQRQVDRAAPAGEAKPAEIRHRLETLRGRP